LQAINSEPRLIHWPIKQDIAAKLAVDNSNRFFYGINFRHVEFFGQCISRETIGCIKAKIATLFPVGRKTEVAVFIYAQ
jgi:hypothetical protein